MKKLLNLISTSIIWIGTRIEIDTQTLARAMTWLFSGQILVSFIGFIGTIVLANLLTETELGTYKYLITLSGIVAILSLNGMRSAVVRAVAQGYEYEVVRSLHTMLKWSIGMVVTALGISLYYLWQGNTTIGFAVLAMSLTVPLYDAFTQSFPYLNGKQLYYRLAISQAIYNGTPPLIATIAALLTHNVLIIFLCFTFSQTFIAISLFYTTIKKYPPNNQTQAEALSYGKHLTLMNLIGRVSFQLDKLLTWHYLGPVQLAIYSVTTAAPQQLRVFNKIIVSIAIPRFSMRSIKTIRTTIWKKMIALLLFSILVVVSYWFAAPMLFEWFLPKYAEYVLYSQVASLVILFFPATLLSSILTAHAHTKELYVTQTLLPIIKIVLLFSLIPVYKLWGIFITIYIIEFLRLIATVWFFLKIPKVSSTDSQTETESYT